MAKIKLNGDTSGYIEISAPAVSGNNTLELGPGTKILTNLDNTFTGVSTFISDVNITSGNLALASATPMVVASNGSGHLRLGAGGSEKVRITSDGKVGIKTDAPKQVFSVVGRANFDLQGDYYGSWINGDSQGSSSFNVGAWHNAGGRMRNEGSHLVLETMNTTHWVQLQPSGGNISVGSNNPNGLLALTASSGRILTLRNSTTGSASGDGSYLALNGSDFQIANAESANIIFYTADTERLRLDDVGRLTITGQGLKLNTNNSNLYTLDGSLSYYATNNAVYLNGAGTSGWLRLNAAGTENNQNAINIFGGSAGAYINMRTSNIDRLKITSAGDVGIGENSPADRLVVQKTNASGDVAVRIKNDTLTDGSSSTPTTASLYLNTSTGDFNSFYIQARRYDNDTHFGYADPRSGGHTPNMIISNEGRVTMPSQPAFSVRRNSSQDIPHNTDTKIRWNTEIFDVGGHFDSSTNFRFTAPVAGKYLFLGHLYIYSTLQVEAKIYKNGSVYKRFSGPVGSGANDNPNGMDFMDIIDLSVNDYVEIFGYHYRSGDSSTVSIYGGNLKETSFVGYLLG